MNKLSSLLIKYHKQNKKFYIFGSTIAASYFSYYISLNFCGFIDENAERIGSKLMNKPIFHPNILDNNSVCFVFNSDKSIKLRLLKTYGNYFIYI